MPASTVSVIVPAYNVGDYIRRCVESLRRQTLREIEIIAVNDRSTDDTGGILDKIAAQEPRLRVLHLPINAGVHGARAAGLAHATGDYIGYVDGDDWVAPDMFASLLRAVSETGSEIAVCGALMAESEDRIGQPKVRFRERRVHSGPVLDRFCRLGFGSGVLWNKLYRADLAKSSGGIPLERAVDASEDYIVNFGAFAAASQVVTLPESLYFYHVRAGSASRASNTARQFVRLVRAYVVCLETHAGKSTRHARLIDEMYRIQLAMDCYRVPDLDQLEPFRAELAESLARLAAVHPAGLYSFTHTFDRAESDQRFSTSARQLLGSARDFVRLWPRAFRNAVGSR